jgi:hypothetical protein
MIDIILIQDPNSGLSLLEYRGVNARLKEEHSEIFSGFLSAIQSISKEINIGRVFQISTEGEKGHHCLIVNEGKINVIFLMDLCESIDFWKTKGQEIGEKFQEMFKNIMQINDMAQFRAFIPIIKRIIDVD